MKKLDETDKKILKELVINPRLSDNGLAKKAGVPLKTVNRKRKELEAHGILNYMVMINNGPDGTAESCLPQMYIVKLRFGLTRKKVMDSLLGMKLRDVDIKHSLLFTVGEQNGQVVLTLVYSSRKDTDILEIFNAEFVPRMNEMFGPGCIASTEVIHLAFNFILLNNYLPLLNMEKGKIRPDWPENLIFVG
jgi:DNA-binding Lrp family transcriptional regulator